jgi:hypothetical protein
MVLNSVINSRKEKKVDCELINKNLRRGSRRWKTNEKERKKADTL